MTLPAGIKKHPVITILALLLVATALWIAWFVHSFDLNQYRRQLEKELTARLSAPVALGEARLRLHDAGVAISFSHVKIGNSSTPASVETRELWMLLEWSGLLQKEVRFSKIGLTQPSVRLDWGKASSAGGSRSGPDATWPLDLAIIQAFRINTLEISDGQFLFNLAGRGSPERRILIREVNGQLKNLGMDQLANVRLSALLDQARAPAPLQLEGGIVIAEEMFAWPVRGTSFKLDITGLDGTSFSAVLADAAPGLVLRGEADLAVRVVAATDGDLTLATSLESTDLTLHLAGSKPPMPLDRLAINGTLQKKDDHYLLKGMTVKLNKAYLTGQATLRPDTVPRRLDLSLSQGSLPLDLLKQIIPASRATLLPGDGQAVLQIEKGEIRLSMKPDEERMPLVEIRQFDASLDGLSWQISPTIKAELASVNISAAGQRWQLQAGAGRLGPAALRFSGQIDLPKNKPPVIDLQLDGDTETAALLAGLPLSGQDAFTLTGVSPFRAHLTGTPERINLDIEAEFDEVDVIYSELLRLPPREGSRITLHGTLTDGHFTIEHARALHGPFSLQASGAFDWSQAPAFSMHGLLEVTELGDVCCVAPFVKQLDLKGAVNLEFDLEGPLDNLRPQATLALRDLGFSPVGINAAVSRVQGIVFITEKGLKSEELLARIGGSAVTLDAEVKDFATPSLLVNIFASKIRADELIFNSDQIYLHDLDGRLLITRDGVEFSPVHVRLPNGTQATVRGSATGRPSLDVNLEISSRFANIAEVIGLWTKVSPEARKQAGDRREDRKDKAGPHRVAIRAEVDDGDLYGMKFQNATGLISHRPGLLQIQPLQFQVDDGACTAQVLLDSRDSTPSLLRISGHAENIAADQIYNELLNQNSIVRGSLSGDFYLQGHPGHDFLPSSYGSFDLMIRDGALRRFHVLSKIFSLLNVAQLFSLQLPDMDAEGMPFNEIAGNLLIDKGILSTERLLVKSEAMNLSYIGKIDLVKKQADFTLAIQPLGTVDKILSRIPVAGWLLTGQEKALITTHFAVRGDLEKPEIDALPATSISEKTLGLIRRTLGLPVKLVTDPAALLGIDNAQE
jgi:hypothetical protein